MRKIYQNLAILTILSYGVLATSHSTGTSIVNNILAFFKDILKGGLQPEHAYFLSFMFYFIVFMAIFMEGLRATPLFGTARSINKQGKTVAVAAAALSTVALFVVDTTSGKTVPPTQKLLSLVKPWGLWGGVIIAAIMALVTYRLVRNSETFDNSILAPAAIAAAIGVTFAGFILSEGTLIFWGFAITLLAILVGILRYFFLGRFGTPEERRTRRETERAQQEADESADDRRSLLEAIIGFLVRAERAANDMIDNQLQNQTAAAVTSARAVARDLGTNLRNARNQLRDLSTENAQHAAVLNEMVRYANYLLSQYNSEIRSRIPAHTATDFTSEVTRIHDVCDQLRGEIGYLITQIQDFIRRGETDIRSNPTAGGGGRSRPYGGRRRGGGGRGPP
tara:strand:- start:8006 stop:9187 length:1182 start_codon:yes stop_codon:yes gene_type:complete